MIFKVIIWAIAALLLLVPILLISWLFVNPKKEYKKNSKYYRLLLHTSTAIVLKVLRIKGKRSRTRKNAKGSEDCAYQQS